VAEDTSFSIGLSPITQ